MWFASGLVMLYVPYPSLSQAERLAGSEPIDWAAIDVPPPTTDPRLPEELVLEMRGGVPVWRVTGWDGERRTISASTRLSLAPVDRAYAARVAGRFGRAPVRAIDRVSRDQWTVAGGFDRHRPLWKIGLDDPNGTELYVSASTGAVVQATTRRERFWNWLGSVPHWLYPTILRQNQSAWRQVVLWVSGPCIAGALTGVWVGLLRARFGRRRYRAGQMSPYRGWMFWHHVTGLGGGLFLIAWICSGWLSVDPGRLFASSDLDETRLRTYAASDRPSDPSWKRLGAIGNGAVNARLTDYAGRPEIALSYGEGRVEMRDAATLRLATSDPTRIARAAQRLLPTGLVTSIQTLDAPDAYWYDRHGLPPLPVLRLRFSDDAATWLHVDPISGEILDRTDRKRRIYRWAFNLLHTWDLGVLLRHGPAREAVVWFFSVLGLVISISGVFLGVRRLRR